MAILPPQRQLQSFMKFQWRDLEKRPDALIYQTDDCGCSDDEHVTGDAASQFQARTENFLQQLLGLALGLVFTSTLDAHFFIQKLFWLLEMRNCVRISIAKISFGRRNVHPESK